MGLAHEIGIQAGMTNKHPVIDSFDAVLALREFIVTNPRDAGGKLAGFCAANLMNSKAQLLQDLLVLFFLRSKRNGFFVEFGATNGFDLSNTFVLEKQFGWRGILAEPAHCWHEALKKNRSAAIDLRCVWSETGHTMEFVEASHGELSTLSALAERDFNTEARQETGRYPVETVSLNDLLRSHNSPTEIDYLSVDTEGSELAILSEFDFTKYDVKILTVEHNYCEPDRERIRELVEAHGLMRVFEPLSKWDDWYIKRSILGM
jgi:FkbM family methyltransferase